MQEHAQNLITGLAAFGWRFESSRRVASQPFTFAIFADVQAHGRACPDGIVSKLAVPIPDDPQTPPPGFHLHPPLGLGTVRNTGGSTLTTADEEWCYWSRPLTEWSKAPTAARIVSHFHSSLRDA